VANFSESRTSARKVSKAVRQEQALRMRIDGRSFPEIARALGYKASSGPFRLVTDALDDLAAKSTENATQLRTLETERCTSIIRDADAVLRDPETKPADKLRALDVKLKASESLRRLWGLDAPTRIAPTTPDGDEEYGGLSDDQRAAAITGLLAAARARAAGQPSDDGEAAL